MPRYLLGEHISEQLQRIPFGWKIYEDRDNNHAAGLGGATFLTINPHSGPYQIIDVIKNYTTSDWASYINDNDEVELARHVAFKIDVTI